MDNPISTVALQADWPKFVTSLAARLAKGAKEYGDVSFTRPLSELLEEIEQEILDQAGWAFIAYCRIQQIKRRKTWDSEAHSNP